MTRWTVDEIKEAVVAFSRKIGARGKQGYVVIVGDFAKAILVYGHRPSSNTVEVYAPAVDAGEYISINGMLVKSVNVIEVEDRKKVIHKNRRIYGVRVFDGEIEFR